MGKERKNARHWVQFRLKERFLDLEKVCRINHLAKRHDAFRKARMVQVLALS